MFLTTLPSTLVWRTAGPPTVRSVDWPFVKLKARVRSPTSIFGFYDGKCGTDTLRFPSVPFHQCSVLTTHPFLIYAIQSQQLARSLHNTSLFKADILGPTYSHCFETRNGFWPWKLRCRWKLDHHVSMNNNPYRAGPSGRAV
jgi:hypothetical protein